MVDDHQFSMYHGRSIGHRVTSSANKSTAKDSIVSRLSCMVKQFSSLLRSPLVPAYINSTVTLRQRVRLYLNGHYLLRG